MENVYLDDTDISTLGLIPLKVDIPSPKPKLYYVEIPGKDGKLDATSFLGDVKFENIIITVSYESKTKTKAQLREIFNAYNGETVSIIVEDSDGSEEYSGRFTGYSIEKNGATCAGKFTIDANPNPEITINAEQGPEQEVLDVSD